MYITIACWCISMVVVWWLREYVSYQGGRFGSVFPAPSHFLSAMAETNFKVWIWSQSASIGKSIVASIYRVIIGLWIWMISAIIAWSAISTSIRIKRFIMPIIQFLAPIAPIAWISMALVLFGIGNQTAIFIVFMWVFFFLTLVTVKAIDTTPERLLYLSKNLWNSSFETRYRVILHHILPSTFTMLRINFMAARMAVLAAEMTWLRDWLWAVIMTWRNLFNYDLIVFWMFLIAIIWLIIDLLLLQIQRTYFWRDSQNLSK